MAKRERKRDDREYDTTQLRASHHGAVMYRDYSAHFWRWSFARRFIDDTQNVLEVGCGQDKPLSKILTQNVAPYVKHYVGVDLNKLEPSGQKRLTFHGQFNFVERYEELLVGDMKDGFDTLVHLEVIEHMHVKNGAKFLKACFECLRPGGKMLMSTPCYDGIHHAANHIHEYTVPELKKAVEKAGFRVERRFGTFMDLRHIGRKHPFAVVREYDALEREDLAKAIPVVFDALAQYYDKDALSCFFAPLYPNDARNNLWVCVRP